MAAAASPPAAPRAHSLGFTAAVLFSADSRIPSKWSPVVAPCSVAAEHDPRRAHAELGEVDPEDVRVLRVVGMQRKPAVQRRYRAEGPQHQPAAPDDDLGSGAEHGPRHHVGPLGARSVPAAEVAPDLGALGDIGPDALVRRADSSRSSRASRPSAKPRRSWTRW